MTIVRAGCAALALSLLVSALACLSPIRWDKKALAELAPLAGISSANSSADFIYVSDVNDWKNGHVADYGLKFLAFPRGKVFWLGFKEDWSEGPWQPSLLIDAAGAFYRPAPLRSWTQLSELPESFSGVGSARATIVASSTQVKDQLYARWPAAQHVNVQLVNWEKSSFFEAPRMRVSIGQFLRLLVAAFILVAAVSLAWGWAALAPGADIRLFAACLALPLLLATHTTLAFFLGKAILDAPLWAFALEFFGAIAALSYAGSAGARACGSKASTPTAPHSSAAVASIKPWPVSAIAVGLVAYFSFSVLRLDFDGDLFSQWLPMARYYYLFGDHDVGALLRQHGASQMTTYPPAFPILIGTLMWIADVPKEASLHFGDASHLAVLLYRMVLVALHFSFLCAVASLFRAFGRHTGGLGWLLPAVGIALAVPIFLGMPFAAEVYLIPFAGFAILALFAGNELNNRLWLRIGLALGGYCLFIKNESLVVLILIVLPWYLMRLERLRDLFSRARAIDLAMIAVGALPSLYWKLELVRLNADTNFAFNRVDAGQLVANPALAATLLTNALKVLLSMNYWVAVLLVLPLAIMLVRPAKMGFMAFLVPAGIFGYLGAMACVYVFSRMDPVTHMELSYGRVIGIAIVSAILFGAHALFSFQQSRVGSEST